MVLTSLFSDYGKLSCRTGNVLISGLANMGAEDCFLGMMSDLMREKTPIFLCTDRLSGKIMETVERAAVENGYQVKQFGVYSCHCSSFNILSMALSVDQVVELLYNFLYTESDSPTVREGICRYIRDCALYLSEVAPRFTVKDILNLRVEKVRTGIAVCSRLTVEEKEDEKVNIDIDF